MLYTFFFIATLFSFVPSLETQVYSASTNLNQFLINFKGISSTLTKYNKYATIFRSSHQSCSIKKVFLKISQNLQENTRARVSLLIMLQAKACNFIKERDPGTGFFL